MSTRAAVALFVSLLAGLAAALLAATWLQQRMDRPQDRIVVAAVDLEPGTRLVPEMLKIVDWPAGSMPAGVFTESAPPSDRVIRTGLSRGEPILESKLAPVGTRGGLSAVIAEGRRAITVRVNDVVGVAGFALPGNYVDIVVNMADALGGSARTHSVSKIVLEQILVLAVAQEASRDDTRPKVVNAVTLEVTPAQAEALDLARSVGSLSLVLRNQVDRGPSSTQGATRDTLLGMPHASAPAAPAPQMRKTIRLEPKAVAMTAPPPAPATQGPCIEVIRGAFKSIDCF